MLHTNKYVQYIATGIRILSGCIKYLIKYKDGNKVRNYIFRESTKCEATIRDYEQIYYGMEKKIYISVSTWKKKGRIPHMHSMSSNSSERSRTKRDDTN